MIYNITKNELHHDSRTPENIAQMDADMMRRGSLVGSLWVKRWTVLTIDLQIEGIPGGAAVAYVAAKDKSGNSPALYAQTSVSNNKTIISLDATNEMLDSIIGVGQNRKSKVALIFEVGVIVNSVRYVTVQDIKLNVVDNAASPGDGSPKTGAKYPLPEDLVTMDIVEETCRELSKGDPGKSAYEDAVELGFEGTIEEWLASNKGEPGSPGAVYTPVLSSVNGTQTMTWQNDGGLTNPDRVSWLGLPPGGSAGQVLARTASGTEWKTANLNYTYTLPTASASVLGGVKVSGGDLIIGSNGVVSVAKSTAISSGSTSIPTSGAVHSYIENTHNNSSVAHSVLFAGKMDKPSSGTPGQYLCKTSSGIGYEWVNLSIVGASTSAANTWTADQTIDTGKYMRFARGSSDVIKMQNHINTISYTGYSGLAIYNVPNLMIYSGESENSSFTFIQPNGRIKYSTSLSTGAEFLRSFGFPDTDGMAGQILSYDSNTRRAKWIDAPSGDGDWNGGDVTEAVTFSGRVEFSSGNKYWCKFDEIEKKLIIENISVETLSDSVSGKSFDLFACAMGSAFQSTARVGVSNRKYEGSVCWLETGDNDSNAALVTPQDGALVIAPKLDKAGSSCPMQMYESQSKEITHRSTWLDYPCNVTNVGMVDDIVAKALSNIEGGGGITQAQVDTSISTHNSSASAHDGQFSDVLVAAKSYADGLILSGVPVGTILMHWSNVIPDGFLLCNKGLVSKTTYSRLYASRPTVGGWQESGDKFYLPDLGGRYPRGTNSGAVGTYLEDAIRNISGGIGMYGNSYAGLYSERLWGALSVRSAGDEGTVRPVLNSTSGETASGVIVEVNLSASKQVPTAEENRPKTTVVNFIIKY